MRLTYSTADYCGYGGRRSCRKVPAIKRNKKCKDSISDFHMGGSRFNYNQSENSLLITEAASCREVPLHFFPSDEFRRYQGFYVSTDTVARNTLLLCPKLIRKETLKSTFKSADTCMQGRVENSPFRTLGFTISDDGWASRAKRHYSSTFVVRPALK